jgi:hypothetical protein
LNSKQHPLLGIIHEPAESGRFLISYSRNFLNKSPIPGRSRTPYTTDFEQAWVDYVALDQIVTGEGWAIARPFVGSKSDESITHVTYIGLDFDSVDPAVFDKAVNSPGSFLAERGYFHYSASHGVKPGVNGHWICRIEKHVEIDSPEAREAWQVLLRQISRDVRIGDNNVKDLQRLFYGAKDQESKVWGDRPVTIAELEEFYRRGKEFEDAAKSGTTMVQIRETGRKYSYNEAYRVTQRVVAPHIGTDGRFPDIMNMDSYSAWSAYFVGWLDHLTVEEVAALMDTFAPDSRLGSFKKVQSWAEGRDKLTRKWSFGTTMLILRHLGFDGDLDVFGQAEIDADVQLATRFLKPEDIHSDRTVTIVKSPKGTGKTELIKALASSGLRVLIVGHRRALLRNTTGRTGIPNYQDIEPNEATSLCITVDSLHKLDFTRQHFDFVIIDEVEQVLQHLTGDTLRDNRPAELTRFKWLLQKAQGVYAFDADVSFVAVNFFSKLLGRQNVWVVENRVSTGDKTIEMYRSKPDLLAVTLDELKAGKRIAFGTNSKAAADEIEEIVRDQFPTLTVLNITQDTSDQPKVQEFIANISEASEAVDVLIFSPSLGTGVSIDNDRFDAVHILGVKDVSTHFDLDQQANRVRRTKDNVVRVFIPGRYDGDDLKTWNTFELRRWCVLNAHETGVQIELADDGTVQGSTSDAWYIELWADITALRNRSMNNLRGCFVELMREQGHRVVVMRAYDDQRRLDAKTKLADAKDRLQTRFVTELLEAPDLDEFEFAEITAKSWMPRNEKVAVQRYEMQQFYQQPVTVELIELDDKEKFRPIVELAEIAAGFIDADYFDLAEASVTQGLEGYDSRIMAPHRRFYGAKRTLLNDAFEKAGLGRLMGNLERFGEGRTYSKESLTASGFVDWLEDVAVQDALQRHLNVKLRADFKEQAAMILTKLLSRVGLTVDEQRKRRGTVQTREYCVNRASVRRLHQILEARRVAHGRRLVTGEAMRITLDDRDGQRQEITVPAHHVVDMTGE